MLHFICHGDYDKNTFFLGFETENGKLEKCFSKNLGNFYIFKRKFLGTLLNILDEETKNLELVFVNACYS